MSRRRWSLLLVFPLALATLRLATVGLGAAAEPPAQAGTSTLADQTALSLTVYNSDLALVRDVRGLDLRGGVSNLEFMDIAASVDPSSVLLRSLSEPSRLAVLEQNYEFDLLEPENLLRKYVGREVTLVRPGATPGSPRLVKARLLSFNTSPVWQIDGEIVTGLQPEEIRFPDLPDTLHARPTLVWMLENTGGRAHRIEASYLASKIAWKADYVLRVDRSDTAADLDGWVTLTNGSGTSFPNASVQFVAGELNRVRRAMESRDLAMAMERAPMPAAPMLEESFGEYHLYSLPRRTSIRHNETKQLSMLSGSRLPIRKQFVVDGQARYYRNAQHPGTPIRDVVQVRYAFRNDQASGLGVPMPAGTVRVYQADARGASQFIGEDRIGHTPKDETLTITIGHAFDVIADRKQTDFVKVANDTYELQYEVRLRNHKDMPIRVEVNEPIGGTWRMVRASHDATRTDAWAARFEVPVPAGGETTLTYRVRVTY